MKRLILGLIGLSLTISSIYADITITGKNRSGNITTYHVKCNNGALSSVTHNIDLSYNPYMSAKYKSFSTLEQAAKNSCNKNKQKNVNKGYALFPGKKCEKSPLSLSAIKSTNRFKVIPLNKNGMYAIKANEGTFLYTTTLSLCKEAMNNL